MSYLSRIKQVEEEKRRQSGTGAKPQTGAKTGTGAAARNANGTVKSALKTNAEKPKAARRRARHVERAERHEAKQGDTLGGAAARGGREDGKARGERRGWDKKHTDRRGGHEDKAAGFE